MPKIKSAIKRVEITERNRQRNVAIKSALRTAMKKFLVLQADSQAQPTDLQVALGHASSLLDRAVHKGVMHKNTVARYKSRLAKKLVTPAVK